jgi:hypothetical protein
MFAGNAVAGTMFDVFSIASYIGVSSMMGPTSIGIALFIAVAALMFKRKNNLILDLSLLSLICLIWSYHRQYDYFVLIIPLVHVLKHWREQTTVLSDVLIVFGTCLIWFAQRIMDAAVSWFPENSLVAVGRHIVFWVACLMIYSSVLSYFQACLQERHRQSAGQKTGSRSESGSC